MLAAKMTTVKGITLLLSIVLPLGLALVTGCGNSPQAPVYAYIVGGSLLDPSLNVVAGYRIDPNTGTVTTLAGSPAGLPALPRDLVVASESGGTFLYVLTSDSASAPILLGYRVDWASGALSRIQSINYQPNAVLRGLTVHPGGKFLYLMQGLPQSCLLAYLIDPATGNLRQSSCTTQVPWGQILIAPPGNFAYGESGLGLTLY